MWNINSVSSYRPGITFLVNRKMMMEASGFLAGCSSYDDLFSFVALTIRHLVYEKLLVGDPASGFLLS